MLTRDAHIMRKVYLAALVVKKAEDLFVFKRFPYKFIKSKRLRIPGLSFFILFFLFVSIPLIFDHRFSADYLYHHNLSTLFLFFFFLLGKVVCRRKQLVGFRSGVAAIHLCILMCHSH